MPMLTFRLLRGWRRAAPAGVLLLTSLSLAACGQAAPAPDLASSARDNYAVNPVAQVTAATTPGSPTTGPAEVKSGSSFGNIDSLPLPSGSPVPAGGATAIGAAGIGTPATGAATKAPDSGFQPEPTKGVAPTVRPAAPGAPAQPTAAAGGATIQRTIPPERVANLYGQLIYVSNSNQIWAVGRDGKNARAILGVPALTDAPGPISNLNLSYDGTQLLYNVGALSEGRAYWLDMTHATLNRVKYNGSWAGDGRHIITSVDGQLHVYSPQTGSDETLGAGDNANWTSDGRIIAVRKNNIWAIPYPAAAGQPRQISYLPDTGDAAWVFSGPLQYHYTNRVLFVGGPHKDLGAQGNGMQLHAVDMSTNTLTNLAVPGGNGVTSLALAPSGLQVAWTEQAHSSACVSLGSVRVARADRPGAEFAIKLPQSESSFFVLNSVTWTPDQWIAYGGQERSCADSGGKDLGPQRIYLVNPAQPNAPALFVEGNHPVWIGPRGLGMVDLGAVALR